MINFITALATRTGLKAVWSFVTSPVGSVSLALLVGLAAGSVVTGARYRAADETKDLRSRLAAVEADNGIKDGAAKRMEQQIVAMSASRLSDVERIANYETELSERTVKDQCSSACVYDGDLRKRLRNK